MRSGCGRRPRSWRRRQHHRSPRPPELQRSPRSGINQKGNRRARRRRLERVRLARKNTARGPNPARKLLSLLGPARRSAATRQEERAPSRQPENSERKDDVDPFGCCGCGRAVVEDPVAGAGASIIDRPDRPSSSVRPDPESTKKEIGERADGGSSGSASRVKTRREGLTRLASSCHCLVRRGARQPRAKKKEHHPVSPKTQSEKMT